jgi:hypothetical protein
VTGVAVFAAGESRAAVLDAVAAFGAAVIA